MTTLTTTTEEEAALLEQRADDYLAGALSAAEVAAFERDLLDPAVARALGEALLIRELMAEVGPEAPPEGLAARIGAALALDEERRPAKRRRWFWGKAKAPKPQRGGFWSGLAGARAGASPVMHGLRVSARYGVTGAVAPAAGASTAWLRLVLGR